MDFAEPFAPKSFAFSVFFASDPDEPLSAEEEEEDPESEDEAEESPFAEELSEELDPSAAAAVSRWRLRVP